jgi:hypothetical protein
MVEMTRNPDMDFESIQQICEMHSKRLGNRSKYGGPRFLGCCERHPNKTVFPFFELRLRVQIQNPVFWLLESWVAAWAMLVANGPRWRLALLIAGLSVCILAVALSKNVGAMVELVAVPSNDAEYEPGHTNPSAWGYEEAKNEAWAKMWPLCASGKSQVRFFSVPLMLNALPSRDTQHRRLMQPFNEHRHLPLCLCTFPRVCTSISALRMCPFQPFEHAKNMIHAAGQRGLSIPSWNSREHGTKAACHIAVSGRKKCQVLTCMLT